MKGGEGRDEEERVGGAKRRKEGSKRQGRTEGEGIGAPHACGGVNAALMAPSAARILEEEGNCYVATERQPELRL